MESILWSILELQDCWLQFGFKKKNSKEKFKGKWEDLCQGLLELIIVKSYQWNAKMVPASLLCLLMYIMPDQWRTVILALYSDEFYALQMV